MEPVEPTEGWRPAGGGQPMATRDQGRKADIVEQVAALAQACLKGDAADVIWSAR